MGRVVGNAWGVRPSAYVVLIGVGLVACKMMAPVTPVSPQVRIGVIDGDVLTMQWPEGQVLDRQFEEYRHKEQAALDQRQHVLKDEASALRAKQSDLARDVYSAQRTTLEERFLTLQKDYMALERELVARRKQIRAEILIAARPRLAQVAKAEGVMIIVDMNETIWSDYTVDLTHRFLSME